MRRRRGYRAALALLLLVCAPATGAETPDAAARARFLGALDALVAAERRAGGWAFPAGPDGRPRGFTLVMQLAERVAAPLGLATWELLVVRSPGTPAAAQLLLDGHRLTGSEAYLRAARRAGDLLVATQLPSGGWFSEMPVERDRLAPWFPWVTMRTTLDDDVTPGATRFLVALWQRTGDDRYRRAADEAADLLARAQLPSGAWPHVWRPAWLRAVRASHEDHPSLNDGLTPLIVETLLAVAAPLERPELVDAARRGGEWLEAVQQLPPRAGWAQQYDARSRPAGMRPFEPPALASWETRHAVDALDALARVTGEARWCASIRAAALWLQSAAVAPGCWARFYDLDDGAPRYLDATGRGVASVAAARPGYDWQGDFGIASLLHRLGLGGVAAPPPLPGDPGACPGGADPLHPGRGVRGLIAQAGLELGTLEPPPISSCAGITRQLVDARTLR